jgi:hypothetical protein
VRYSESSLIGSHFNLPLIKDYQIACYCYLNVNGISFSLISLSGFCSTFFSDIVELFLLDCSGKEVYMEMLSEMMKSADMIVAIYDVTKTESFGNVTKASDFNVLIFPKR